MFFFGLRIIILTKILHIFYFITTITTVVTISEILNNNGLATEKSKNPIVPNANNHSMYMIIVIAVLMIFVYGIEQKF